MKAEICRNTHEVSVFSPLLRAGFRILSESPTINYLLKKTKEGEYQGGLIGPTVGSFFVTAILLHETMKRRTWNTEKLLVDFYDFYIPNPNSSKTINDKTLIACVRHALAHNNFSLNIDYLEFWNDYGNFKISIEMVTKFQNTLFRIYNLNR